MYATKAVIDGERSALRSVQDILRDWTRWRSRWRPKLGYPRGVCWIDEIRGAIDSYAEAEDYDQRIDAHVMRAVDRAVEDDLTREQRCALHVVYLNEIGPAAWRSNRVPLEEVRRLCNEAETRLIPALRRRNVLL